MASLESGNPEAVAQAQGAIKAAVYELGRLHGWSAQEVTAKTVEHLAPMHASVVDAAVDGGRLDYARQYMEQVKAELTPQARERLGKLVKIGDIRAQSQAFGDEVIGKGLGLADALAEARTRFQGKDEDEAVREVKERYAEQEVVRARDVKQVSTSAWAAVMQTGKIPPTLLADLRTKAPEEERQIRDWLEAKYRRAKDDAEGKKTDGFDTFYGMVRLAQDEPARFAEMDLRKVAPLVGKEQISTLVRMQTGISKGDAKAMEEQNMVKATLGLIKGEVAAIGIDLSPKEGTAQAKETATFLGALSQSLMQAAQAKGSPLTSDEAKRIGMNMVREGVEQGSGIFGIGQTTKRGYQIATDPNIKPGASFIVAPFDKIPADVRNSIVTEYRAAKGLGTRPLNSSQEEEIERAYTRGVQQGRFK
jgi:hypothetical protein